MLATPKGGKNQKSLKGGTEKKDQNKHLKRQGLNVWRAVQQGKPWQQMKQQPLFNHRLSCIHMLCLSLSNQ